MNRTSLNDYGLIDHWSMTNLISDCKIKSVGPEPKPHYAWSKRRQISGWAFFVHIFLYHSHLISYFYFKQLTLTCCSFPHQGSHNIAKKRTSRHPRRVWGTIFHNRVSKCSSKVSRKGRNSMGEDLAEDMFSWSPPQSPTGWSNKTVNCNIFLTESKN